jgi:hypothetical protein
MDLDRVQFVTQRYPELRGLQTIPIAAVFLMAAIWLSGWLGPRHPVTTTERALFFAGLFAAMLVCFPIRDWYTKTFGFVSHAPQTGVRPFDTIVVFLCALWLPDELQWLVPVVGMSVAASSLWIGTSCGAARKHYVAVAFVWSFFMMLEASGLSEAAKGALLHLNFALCLIIAGVGDHRLLRQTLQPLQPPIEA